METAEEKIRTMVGNVVRLNGLLAATAGGLGSFANALVDSENVPDDMKLALQTHGVELAAAMDSTADSLAAAWVEMKRASGVVWASSPMPAKEGAKHVL